MTLNGWLVALHSTAQLIHLSELTIHPYYHSKKCSPGTLLSGSIRLVQVFVGRSVMRGITRHSGGQNRWFLVILVAVSFERLQLKPVLCFVMQCLIGFPVTLKSLTLTHL